MAAGAKPPAGAGPRGGSARVRGGMRWMDEHVADPFVQRARREGYRSRAAYKLLELDERHRLLRPGQTVVDLGAAPGSWAQVVRRRLGGSGTVIALDLLPMDPIDGVLFIQGDMRSESMPAQLAAAMGNRPADLVLSDMAPNLSGVAAADAARGEELIELAADFAVHILKPQGIFVVKLFNGAGFEPSRALLKTLFASVLIRKPAASRDRSAEVYAVAAGPRR